MERFCHAAMRAAVLLHGHLAARATPRMPPALPGSTWQALLCRQRQIELAASRGWSRVASRLLGELPQQLDRFQWELTAVRNAVARDPCPAAVPSPVEIYRDLVALRREFAQAEIDLRGRAIEVTTDRIVLDGIGLGCFQVRLEWEELTQAHPYRVIALEPNPAARREDVTHPHVQDGILCEGEGRRAIRAALAQVRLLDFFLLVSQTLHSYGRGSGYVELGNWHGPPCTSCGAGTTEDDRCYCRACDDVLCESCASSCASCGETFCTGCLAACAVCDQDTCPDCRQTCSRCRQERCRNWPSARQCSAAWTRLPRGPPSGGRWAGGAISGPMNPNLNSR
jgi:hypothetical protein